VTPFPLRRSIGTAEGGDIPDFSSRLRRARLGLGLALAMVTVTFAVFSVTFVFRRFFAGWLGDDGPGVDSSTAIQINHWRHIQLPIALFVLNTFILLLSSVAMEFARRQVARRAALAPVERIPGVSLGNDRNLPWLAVAIVLGVGFVVGQTLAWRNMAAHGIYLSTMPSSTFVYLATILHAIHVGAGLLALLFAAAMPVWHASWDARRIVVDVSGFYWHFMAVLWLYLFALLALIN